MTTRMTGDGRNILHERGELSGEAAQMKVGQPAEAWPLAEAERALPIERPAQVEGVTPTYYDLPVVKPPPWKWYIPAYLYVGGVAGAAAAVASAARFSRQPALAHLARKTRWIATVGDAIGGILLIADLGRPARFLNMLRVFRPTSPMNLGTWILTGSGLSNGLALLADLRGGWPRANDAASGVAGLLGPSLSTYTAVLLSNTAMPTWARSRRSMPMLFAASALTGAASMLELAGARSGRERRVVRALAVAGKAAEALTAHGVERELGNGPERRPLRRGRSGTMWKAAKVLGAASLVASLWPGSSRRTRLLAGVLGTAGTMALRYAVFEAGMRSGRDPRATFVPQRQRMAMRRPPAAPERRQPTRDPAPREAETSIAPGR